MVQVEDDGACGSDWVDVLLTTSHMDCTQVAITGSFNDTFQPQGADLGYIAQLVSSRRLVC